tara:strand:- start:4826 stop:5281 length:456 start_codon:yes stop_codon:yes gene_type:complete
MELHRMAKRPETMEKMIAEVPKENAIEDMPLTTYEEHKSYNAAARKENKRLRLLRYPCKPCPIELHPKERIVFGRVDQPLNALPVHISNHLIHFEQILYPGKSYDLPRVVINYLAEKGVPHWKWYDNPDGSSETRISHREPRFSLRTTYAE